MSDQQHEILQLVPGGNFDIYYLDPGEKYPHFSVSATELSYARDIVESNQKVVPWRTYFITQRVVIERHDRLEKPEFTSTKEALEFATDALDPELSEISRKMALYKIKRYLEACSGS